MNSVNVEAEKKKIAQLIIDAWEAEVNGDREALLDFFSEGRYLAHAWNASARREGFVESVL
jgi:hypothetical protein